MKKLKIFLISLLALLPIGAKAASVHCSVPSSVVSGSTFSVKIYGSLSGAGGIWFGKIGAEGNASYVNGNLSFGGEETQSFSRTVTYKAGNPGTATFYAYDVDAASDIEQISTSDRCTVTIVAASSSNTNKPKPSTNNNKKPDPNKSSNNNLKSITIDGVELTPEFNKDTLEYSSVVEGNIEKITINAEVEDGKSHVDGLGEKELQEGLNEIILYVNAENGDVKEYRINITRKEKNPIIVTIDGKKYTVVKKETEMELPDGYSKETIMIDEMEVTAYTNEKVGRTLVVLVDEEGNTGFFVYDSKKDTYTEFKEFASKELKLLLINKPNEKIPFGYKKITFSINGQKVDGYYYKSKDKFRLVYGVDLDNGDEGFYQYDMKQKTFQRYYGNQLKDYYKYGKYALYASCGVVLLLLIFIISTISLGVKNRKLKKNVRKEEPKKEVKEQVKKEVEEPKVLTRAERLKLKEEQRQKEEKQETKEIKKEAEEKTTVLELDKTKEISTREQRRLEKEKQKRLKKEADEFLK